MDKDRYLQLKICNFVYFELVSIGNFLYILGMSLEHLFRRPPEVDIGTRMDCGHWKIFSESFSVDDFFEKYAIRQDGAALLPFRLQLQIEDIFLPALTPAHYNSKKATGMVGLENLGATCYLNSLLQVCYLYLCPSIVANPLFLLYYFILITN